MTTTVSSAFDFLVRRNALGKTRFAPARATDDVDLDGGQALAAIDTFAFSANNVTYAVFGDAMQYWDFYRAPEGWGRIPVWGFAEIVRSSVPEIRSGERLFGYWPMSTWTVIEPTQVTAAGFHDATAHRQHLHAVYNYCTRVAADPSYHPAREAQQMLLRVLFLTAFFIDDFLSENDFFGARSVVVASASSKTALSLAYRLRASQCGRMEVVGLTSPAHTTFLEELRCYDQVRCYDELEMLPAEMPTVFVDLAGDGRVVRGIHKHFGESLKHSCMAGSTHWKHMALGQQLPGVQPVPFFAPHQAARRSVAWGPVELQRRTDLAWMAFVEPVSEWIRIVHGRGRADIERVYQDVLAGRSRPDEGYVLSLQES